jgi:L-arabinose isomerase
MTNLKTFEAWFVTGSQHLYGEETLKTVAAHSKEIAGALDTANGMPVRIVYKSVATTPEEIYKACKEANDADNCGSTA